jgi:hypothetical protein
MKKGEKKKQQKALKRRNENRQVQKQLRGQGGDAPQRYLRQARQYPFSECWVQRDWDSSGLAVVVITRQQPDGNLIFGSYLTDVYCLGVKDTLWEAEVSPREFKHDWLPRIYEAAGKPQQISPELAHEIIYGAIEYAQRFGFKPHRDFAKTHWVLDPPEAHPLTGRVKFGKDGQPFFIAGPHDNVEAVLRQLARTAGEGHYHYLHPLGNPFDEDEEWDEDETWDRPADRVIDMLDFDSGDTVVVKAGVQDPDMGNDLSGWQGRVLDIIEEGEEDPLVTIEWDSQTLNHMPASVLEHCTREKLNWAIINLSATDVERAELRDTPDDVVQARIRLIRQYGDPFVEQDEQDLRIAAVLADVNENDVMAALDVWEDYLAQHLTFPFEAEVSEFQERGPLQTGEVVSVIGLAETDDLYGVLVNVNVKRKEYIFPLCDLEVRDKRLPLYQIVKDYVVWYANR